MHILIATDTFSPDVNGVAVFSQNLAVGLAERGHEVLIVTLSTTTKDEEEAYRGVPVFRVRSLPVFFRKDARVSPPLFLRPILEEKLHAFRPDIVHIQDPFPLCWLLLRVAKDKHIPTVGTHHTEVEIFERNIVLPPFMRKYARYLGWAYFCQFFGEMDVVTSPTASAASSLRKKGFSHPVVPISCGIDLSHFHPRRDTQEVRMRYALPEKPLLLSVGRLDKDKEVHRILEAVPALLQEIDLHLVIVGGGEDEDRLRKMITDLHIEQAVTFTGVVSHSDLPGLLSLAECFVIAATAETQSVATMEAMACGLPIVAARASALPELVRDGENGYLFDPEDHSSLVKALSCIFADPGHRKRLSEGSLRLIAGHDLRKTVIQYEQLYYATLPPA